MAGEKTTIHLVGNYKVTYSHTISIEHKNTRILFSQWSVIYFDKKMS